MRLDQIGYETLTTTIITYEEQSRGWLAYLSEFTTAEDLVRGYGKLSDTLPISMP